MKVYKITYNDKLQGVTSCQILASCEVEAVSVFNSLSYSEVLSVGRCQK